MTQTNKPDRLVILSKGFGVRFEKVFFLQIQEAFLEGYRIAETDLRDDVSMRNFQGRQGRAVMYLEGTAPEKWTPAKAEDVKEPEVKVEDVKEPETEVKETGVASYIRIKNEADAYKAEALLSELSQLDKMQGLKDFAETHGIAVSKSITSKAGLKTVIEEALKA